MKIDRIFSFFTFLLAGILWTPIIPGYFGIKTSFIYIPLIFICTSIALINYKKNANIIFFSFIYEVTILSTSYYISSVEYLKVLALFPAFLIISNAISSTFNLKNNFCDYLTSFSLLAVAMMVLGVAYAAIGGSSFLEFPNPDGRLSLLYLTTIANEGGVDGVSIRPSFIYDEPGAISFVLWVCIAIRESLGRERKISWLIAVGGLLTISVTHFILIIIFIFFKLKINIKNIGIFISVLIFLYIIMLLSNNLDVILNRIDLSAAIFSENNRSLQVFNFLNAVNVDIILFGAYECFESIDKVCKDHGDITSSPLTPLYYGGIALLIIQICTLIYLLLIIFKDKKNSISAIIVFVLVMQRPYFNIIGYGLLIYIALLNIYYNNKAITK